MLYKVAAGVFVFSLLNWRPIRGGGKNDGAILGKAKEREIA